MEKNVNTTTKALPAPASTPAAARTSCETCGYKNRKRPFAPACYAAVAEADAVAIPIHKRVDKITYGDLEALFGSAAAERLALSRKASAEDEAATFDCEDEVRSNLIRVLLKKGVRLTPEDVAAIKSGNYNALEESARVIPYALEDIVLAERYEFMIRHKRERQIKRGATAFREDETRDKLVGAAAVAYAATLIAKTAIAVKKIIKG